MNERTEEQAVQSGKKVGGWLKGEEGEGWPCQSLIYSGVLIEWGKKAGKQVIQSTGLSIEAGVGGT